MSCIVFENATVFDGISGETPHGQHVAVADGLVRDISDRPIAANAAQRIDCRGKVLMPGLIDAHVHVYKPNIIRSLVCGCPPSTCSRTG